MDPTPSSFPHIPPTSTHPDSANSSSRSRPETNWDDHPLPPVPGAKLRLMCSYGGHIIPRPHDKSLCYVGGDTRIVVVDRHSSLADLHSRLSQTLLNGRHFTLKYQLPSEDLDSLISLATDEDLENMIEEYDRTTATSPLKSSRLRLFLFPSKPETAASMGSLLDDAKSETWFVDALNGAGLLPRGLSESAAMDTFLELDHGIPNSTDSICADLEAQNIDDQSNNKHLLHGKANAQELVMDSPHLVETTSSFGSSSSSPSMANLPPIRVRGEDYLMVELDEQFSHGGGPGFGTTATSPPIHCGGAAAKSEDEKSDQRVAAVMRKPPLPLQPVQRKLVDIHNLPSPDSKHAGSYNLPSPDSVASDNNMNGSAGSLSKHTVYQDATQVVNPENRLSPNDTKISNNTTIDLGSQVLGQQLVDAAVNIPPPQQNQQHFIHNTHYIHHPISSYNPMYLRPQTQQTDPHYPMYLPSYDVFSTPPMTPPLPPVYPTNPEIATNIHQMGGTAIAPMLVQVPPHQCQQHCVGLAQIPPPTPSSAASVTSNYGYEYPNNHMQDYQGYYAQQLATSAPPPSPPPQYQTMTPAAAMMFSHVSTRLPPDNTTQHS